MKLCRLSGEWRVCQSDDVAKKKSVGVVCGCVHYALLNKTKKGTFIPSVTHEAHECKKEDHEILI